jgi:GT2 family glycosyltransferase
VNIHITVVAYGLADDLRELFHRATSEKHAITWHLFLHSQIGEVVAACDELAAREDVIYYPFGKNRGLARSWNQGIINGYNNKADICMIINDDMQPVAGDVDKVAEAAAKQRDKYVMMCMGTDARKRKRVSMHFGFTAVNPLAIQVIGMFDENYFPIYGEDADYVRRAKLAGLQHGMVRGTKVIHQGSKNIYTAPGLLEQNQKTYAATLAYQIRKWGGHYGQERYTCPFDDPTIGLRIDPAPEVRHAPYPGYNRDDQDIVAL